MSTSKQFLPGLLLAGCLAACGPMLVEPELTISASPRTLDGVAQKATIKVVAVDDKAKPGSGKVRITSVAGSLKDGVEVDLLAGEGTTDFTCARATDPACTGAVRLTAEWVVSGKLASASTSVTITPAVVVVPDAGMTLTASRTQVGIGLGQSSQLTGTYSVDGVPTPGNAVALTTSLGNLLFPDGGPFVSPATTDFAGQIHAVLVDDGSAGTAQVTATPTAGRPASVSVTVFRPDAGIMVMTDRTVLTVGFNEIAQLTVNHTLDGRAVPGRMIQLETSAGQLLEVDGGTFVSPALTDTNGRVRALLSDTGSPGVATITASDPAFSVSATTTVNLAQPDAGVFVTVGKPRLYVGVNDSTTVSARLVTNGTPAVGRTLQVATNLGTLLLADGGVFSGSGTTDSSGALSLELREGGVDGIATITATDPMSMRTGAANVEVLRIGTIAYVSTTCAGTPCSVMGIRNSGFNTQATLRFTLRDSRTNSQPVSGVRVTFVLNNQPTGTVATASGVSDAQGNVDAVVTSGDSIGSFSVTATVIPGISATSPTIGVRGAKPSSKGFSFQCPRVNLPAYRSPSPPLLLNATCSIVLVDRNNNPVGAGTTVQFLSEAGNIQNSAPTTPYVPPLGPNEGRGTVSFDTSGQFPAADVPPLTALPGQFPFARAAETQTVDGFLTRNPRDGLVTLVAYTDGEEWFSDSNSNGIRDGVEQFIDQGEPLVDVNDDDIWNVGENYIDVDGNGAWTGPNGVWDASTKIWTKTYLLYTDYAEPSNAVFVPSTFNVARGTTSLIDVLVTDRNRNIVEANSTVMFTRTASKGSISLMSLLGLDGFGFTIEPRRLTNAAGTGDCLNTEQVCQYRTAFGVWSPGPVARLTVTGAASTDMSPSEAVTITVGVTTLGTQSQMSVSGTIQ
ncbi:MAG: hypothetical protein Q8N23_15365 [Archangium sp.]|nr:hypothetical protein [Archangium sp.]MDP3154052.1 hypothetical protein [Archangium sp.]MDP3570045.1 hypothetical protein [Archangium sp.]